MRATGSASASALARALAFVRQNPQKSAGLSVILVLSLVSLILYIAYLRTPPAPKPQTLSIYPSKPSTRPTANRSHELLEDSLIIQANSAQLEQRRLALDQMRAARALDRGRPGPSHRPPPPEARSALERLFRPRPAAAATALPATAPTTQASR